MRCLVVADVHSNLEAFQAVVADAESSGGFGRILCLGDIVGYGPDPGECLALLRSYPHAAVAGNHDLAAIGELSVETFNPAARAAAMWTRHRLTADEQAYLRSNPLRHEEGDATLLHGTPREPVWEYFLPWLMSSQDTDECFRLFSTSLCLLGHSHLPFLCDESGNVAMLEPGATVEPKGARVIVNPGSVGQPRDGDPRAAYALYDADIHTFTHRRVAYDIERTQVKMASAGLPDALAARSSGGNLRVGRGARGSRGCWHCVGISISATDSWFRWFLFLRGTNPTPSLDIHNVFEATCKGEGSGQRGFGARARWQGCWRSGGWERSQPPGPMSACNASVLPYEQSFGAPMIRPCRRTFHL